MSRNPHQLIVRPTNMAELIDFANAASKSDLVPKEYKDKPHNIMLAVQMGSELGLAPMQSIQNIAVINGRPAVWGDAIPGLVRQSGLCLRFEEWMEGEGDERAAFCLMHRRGDNDPIIARFSVADAKKARLWQDEERVKRRWRDQRGEWQERIVDNDSPWFRYPDRMLKWRARGYAARDAFPDVLKGLISAEEAMDLPPPTIDAAPDDGGGGGGRSGNSNNITRTPPLPRDRNAAAVARAQHIIEHGNEQGTTKATRVPDAHPELAGDGIPALEPNPEPRMDLLQPDDPLHDEVEVAIKKFARVTTADVFQRGMASVQDLLRRCDDAERGELKMMLLETMSAARKRIAEAAPQNAENLS
jgi:hypothetical protein